MHPSFNSTRQVVAFYRGVFIIIHTSEEHIAACNRVSELMGKEDLTEEESLEMDILADAIVNYEESFEYKHLSPFYQ